MTANDYALPEGWRWARLDHVCEFAYGSSLPERSRRGGSVPVYGSNGIVGYHDEALTAGATIIIGRKGSIGEVNFSSMACWPIDTTYYIEHPKAGADLRWLYYVLKSLNLQEFNKAAAVPGLNRNDAYSLEIPLPPLDEQRRIAAILDEQMAAVEQARAAAEAQLEAAQGLMSAYLRQVFESEEAQGWERLPLSQLVPDGFKNGAFKRPHQFGSGVLFVNVSDLYSGFCVSFDTVERVEYEDGDFEKYGLEPGDLLFCRSSVKREGIGEVCHIANVPEPSIFDCHIIRARVDTRIVLPEYVAFYWMLPEVRAGVITSSKTATMTTMSQKDLGRAGIPIAPLDVQQTLITNFHKVYAAAKDTTASLQKQLDQINVLPASLLRRAFSGEL